MNSLEFIVIDCHCTIKFKIYCRMSMLMLFDRSIVAPEHVRGYIYIEAFKQTLVKDAIAGNYNLFKYSNDQSNEPVV